MKREVILTFGYDIEIPEEYESKCLESYTDLIDSQGGKEGMYSHIAYTHLVLRRDFVEGVGSIKELGIEINERTPCAEVDGTEVI